MTIHPTPRRRYVSIIAGIIVLASCSGSVKPDATPIDTMPLTVPTTAPVTSPPSTNPATTAPPSTAVATTTTPPTSPPATAAPTTTSPPVTTILPTTTVAVTTTVPPVTTTTVRRVNGAACLIGDWLIADDDLAAYFDVVGKNAAFDSIAATGRVRLNFTDTTYAWANYYNLSIQIDGASYESASSGWFGGRYTEAGGVMTGTLDNEHRESSVTKDGKPLVDGPGDLFVDINPARPMDKMKFSCDGPKLVLGAGPLAGAEHEVTLTRA